jgi:LPS export ABC transporter protein LptC
MGAVRELCEMILAAQSGRPPDMTPPRQRIDRLVAWSPVLFMGGLAALTYWLDAQVQSSGRRDDGSSRHDPDLFIERFSAVTFDVDGRVRQMLAATRAEHFPDDGSVDLIGPAFEVTDPESRGSRSPPARVRSRAIAKR